MRRAPYFDLAVEQDVIDVKGARPLALLGDFVRHDEPHPVEPGVSAPWYSLDYTYVMEPGEAVLPRPPIK